MLKIAITGNIASGKSLVLNYFKEQGWAVLSLDESVNELYSEDFFKKRLCALFDTDIKSEIAQIVFNDYKQKQKLEDMIYPLILDKMLSFLKNNPFAMVEAPMLFESGFDKYFDKIILVLSDDRIREKRLKIRSGFQDLQIKKRMKAQIAQNKKINSADFIIHNNFDIKRLYFECEKILKLLPQKR